MSFRVKESLVIHGAAAVILARVLWIIHGSIAGSPAGAVLFPDFVVFLPAVCAHGDPGTFPVADADAGRRAVDDGIRDVPDAVGLPLDREGIVLYDPAAVTDGIGREVCIFCGKGIGGFHDHDLLAVGFSNLRQDRGKVVKGSVPVRIIGSGRCRGPP